MTEEIPERNPKPERQQKLEKEPISLVAINDVQIKSMIYTVRGEQVMLDSDLAKLYGVETKVLNQAVGRNVKRFPERFCFRLTKNEAVNLRSQIVTLRPELGEQGSWWGASLKDAGKKSFAIARIEDASIIDAVLSKLMEGR